MPPGVEVSLPDVVRIDRAIPPLRTCDRSYRPSDMEDQPVVGPAVRLSSISDCAIGDGANCQHPRSALAADDL
jgi:hypothetical protein